MITEHQKKEYYDLLLKQVPIFRTLADIIFIFTQKVPMHNFIQLLWIIV